MALFGNKSDSALNAEILRKQYEEFIMKTPNPGLSRWPDVGNSHAADAMKYAMPSGNQQSKPDKFTAHNMRRQIASRMGWDDPGTSAPFQVMEPARLNDQEAVVFIVTDGKAIMIHDDLNLFPSDALVTQLRLLTN